MTALQLIRRLRDATMQSKCIQRSHTLIGSIICDDMELFVRGFDDVLNLILGERADVYVAKRKGSLSITQPVLVALRLCDSFQT